VTDGYRPRIGWRKKALAFRLFSAMPRGETLYYLTQRYVTRTLPRNLAHYGKWQHAHARTFQRLFRGDVRDARLFEFGAGWDLHSNLSQWCYGIDRQVVMDIARLARLDQVNRVIDYLKRNPPPDAVRVPGASLTGSLEDALERQYGIRYLAPADARHTGLEPGSVDLICTTSVLEHIPAPELEAIVRECHRICSGRAVVSHVVDYSDHYAHTDASIGVYNFLRFTDREWSRFSPPLHYQNRLRHFEYGELFRRAGFRVIQEETTVEDTAAADLARVPLAERFRAMTAAQILPRTGHWVLTRD
jgi:hypothetical protein